jgi:hypothetical protein
MKEQEIFGIKLNLLFYYPLGENNLHAQIYDNNENVIFEEVVKTQKEYDFILDVFTVTN